MKDFYETKRIIIGNLCIILPFDDVEGDTIGPLYVQTTERFIFEKVEKKPIFCHINTHFKKPEEIFYTNIFFEGKKLLIYDSVLNEKVFARNFDETYIKNVEAIDKYLTIKEKASGKISIGRLVSIYYDLNIKK